MNYTLMSYLRMKGVKFNIVYIFATPCSFEISFNIYHSINEDGLEDTEKSNAWAEFVKGMQYSS